MRQCLSTLLVFCVVLASCGLRHEYKALSKHHKQRVVQYNVQAPLADSFQLHEINAGDIKQQMQDGKYTLVLSWVPHCTAKQCRTLGYYNRFARQMDSLGVTTFLISSRYEADEIERQYKRYSYPGKIYVIDKDAYGKHLGTATRYFMQDLTDKKIKGNDSLWWCAYKLFKGKELVSYGGEREKVFEYVSSSK